MIEQFAEQGWNVRQRLWDRGPRSVEVRITPDIVGRQHWRQPLERSGVIVEAGHIGVGQRLVDMRADMLGAPSVVEPDVEQMRSERQLRHDASLIEKVAGVGKQSFLDPEEEALGVSIAAPAKKPTLSRSGNVRRGPDRRRQYKG